MQRPCPRVQYFQWFQHPPPWWLKLQLERHIYEVHCAPPQHPLKYSFGLGKLYEWCNIARKTHTKASCGYWSGQSIQILYFFNMLLWSHRWDYSKPFYVFMLNASHVSQTLGRDFCCIAEARSRDLQCKNGSGKWFNQWESAGIAISQFERVWCCNWMRRRVSLINIDTARAPLANLGVVFKTLVPVSKLG